MTRQELIDHITKTYSASPEFPFPRDNESRVFRHGSNRKWFALVMRVPYQTLGQNVIDERHYDGLGHARKMANTLYGGRL